MQRLAFKMDLNPGRKPVFLKEAFECRYNNSLLEIYIENGKQISYKQELLTADETSHSAWRYLVPDPGKNLPTSND